MQPPHYTTHRSPPLASLSKTRPPINRGITTRRRRIMAQPPMVPETTTGKALATWALPPIMCSSSSSSSASNESPAAAEEPEETSPSSPPRPAAAALVTTSSCTTETVEGVHLFKVNQYRLIKDLGVGKSVRSGGFSVGGYRWAVLFYPSGSEPPKQPGGARHVSAYLELLTPNVDQVRVMFDLSLLTAGSPHAWVAGDSLPVDSGDRRRSFFKEGDFRRHAMFSTMPPPRPRPPHHPPRCWGVAELARSDLAPYIVDGGLVIQCDVTVIKPPRVTRTRPVAVPPPGPGKDRRRLPEKEKRDGAADVEVLVRGESVAARRALLAARSPVLRKRLHETGNTAVAGDDDDGKENDEDGEKRRRHTAAKRVAVTVDDVEPAVFKAMLHFIYTDELPPESTGEEATELLRRLFEAAEAYGVERLPQMCEAALCARLSKATIKATAAFAKRHGGSCGKLKTACVEFYKATHRPSETTVGSEQRLKRSLPAAGEGDDDSEATADKRLKRA